MYIVQLFPKARYYIPIFTQDLKLDGKQIRRWLSRLRAHVCIYNIYALLSINISPSATIITLWRSFCFGCWSIIILYIATMHASSAASLIRPRRKITDVIRRCVTHVPSYGGIVCCRNSAVLSAPSDDKTARRRGAPKRNALVATMWASLSAFAVVVRHRL